MMFKLILAAILAVGVAKGDGWHSVCPKPKTIEKFSLKDFAGEWSVYQRTPTRENNNKECNHFSFKYIGESALSGNYTVYNSLSKAFEVKTFNVAYNPERPGVIVADDYTGQPSDSPTLDLNILDLKPDEYALLYLCQSKFDGQRTEETAYLLLRSVSSEPSSSMIGALDGVLQSNNYAGQPLVKVNHSGNQCRGL